MLTKLCQYCHRRVPIGEVCKCRQRCEAMADRKRAYRKAHETSHSFYDSKEWKRVRDHARQYYMGVDILKWYR